MTLKVDAVLFFFFFFPRSNVECLFAGKEIEPNLKKETLVQKGFLTWEHKKNDDPDKLTGEQWLQVLAAGMPKVHSRSST